ncbi:DMT family transporter, partial [Alphaproteobacteria bacterium]|nr:DMT family transporter [Alphaproteobacteria bacterium]
IGGTFAFITLLIFLMFQGGIKKHILLKKQGYYFIPLVRGLHFFVIIIIIFYSLKYIPINIFTLLLMTTPFFLVIFAKFILKEKLNIISWVAIIIGFIGVAIVLKPINASINIYVFLVLFVALSNALSFTLVSRYSHIASTYGFTFYGYVPAIFFSYIFFFNDPMLPSGKEFLLFASSGVIVMISGWALTAAYHIAGKYSSIISPFIFLQILWGSLYGMIFFSEKMSSLSIIGIVIVIASGSAAIYNRNK